jgi:hypothetical protein
MMKKRNERLRLDQALLLEARAGSVVPRNDVCLASVRGA